MLSFRTPESRFASLPDFDYPPHYAEVPDGELGTLRMGWVEDGPPDGPVVLLLHGEPSWSYLYRHMMPVLAAAGLRAVAVDLVGFGRSDKPTHITDYSYLRHVEWVRALIFDVLDLQQITLVGQDWGGFIGLRLAGEHPERFARIVASNTGLPTGDDPMPEQWWQFRRAVERAESVGVSRFVQSGCTTKLPAEVLAAYDAPFPEEVSKAGVRAFPGLVPTEPDDPASVANRAAWQTLRESPTPVLLAFSDGDRVTAQMAPLLAEAMPGARGREHPVIGGAGHFLQEDAGVELARHVVEFVRTT